MFNKTKRGQGKPVCGVCGGVGITGDIDWGAREEVLGQFQ